MFYSLYYPHYLDHSQPLSHPLTSHLIPNFAKTFPIHDNIHQPNPSNLGRDLPVLLLPDLILEVIKGGGGQRCYVIQCLLSVSDLDPHGSALILVGWGYGYGAGSRRAKVTQNNKKGRYSSFGVPDVLF
jgi:hypothetical protein